MNRQWSVKFTVPWLLLYTQDPCAGAPLAAVATGRLAPLAFCHAARAAGGGASAVGTSTQTYVSADGRPTKIAMAVREALQTLQPSDDVYAGAGRWDDV